MLRSFLDIEGAFTILQSATRKGVGATCRNGINIMLESRIISTRLIGETVAAEVIRRCPQVGVLSPVLWNLVVIKVVGYADDIFITVQAKFN